MMRPHAPEITRALASATPALDLYRQVKAGQINYVSALRILEDARNRPVISLIDEAERDQVRISPEQALSVASERLQAQQVRA